MAASDRDYESIASRLSPDGTREQRMQAVSDALWEALKDRGVSWVGFYFDRPDQPDEERLVLGPHRDKPACSPLALHGVCGQAVRFGATRIVQDVRDLRADYIACDPHDRSEIVIPLIDEAGQCWAVLDLDSWDVGAFDEDDEAGLKRVLKAARLLA